MATVALGRILGENMDVSNPETHRRGADWAGSWLERLAERDRKGGKLRVARGGIHSSGDREEDELRVMFSRARINPVANIV